MALSAHACAPHATPLSFCHAELDALALQVGDDLQRIREAHCAYACVEKLVLPQRVGDCEDLYPTRSEFGALMRLLNDETRQRLEAADASLGTLRQACSHSRSHG